MIPPLVERCPRCGYVGPPRRYRLVTDGVAGGPVVACPVCGHQFRPVGDPRLT